MPTSKFNKLWFFLHLLVYLPILYILLVANVSNVNWAEILLFLFAGFATVSLEIIVGNTIATAETITEIYHERQLLCQHAGPAIHALAAAAVDKRFWWYSFRLGTFCFATLVCSLLFLNLVMLEVKRMGLASEMIPASDMDKIIQECLIQYRDRECKTCRPGTESEDAPTPAAPLQEPRHQENTPIGDVNDTVPCEECPEAITSRDMQKKLSEAFEKHHKDAVTERLLKSSGASSVFIFATAIISLFLVVFRKPD